MDFAFDNDFVLAVSCNYVRVRTLKSYSVFSDFALRAYESSFFAIFYHKIIEVDLVMNLAGKYIVVLGEIIYGMFSFYHDLKFMFVQFGGMDRVFKFMIATALDHFGMIVQIYGICPYSLESEYMMTTCPCLLLNGHNSRYVYRHYGDVISRDDSDAEECTGWLEEELVRKRSTIVDTDSVGVVFDVGFLNKKHDMCCVGVYKDDSVDLASVGRQADNGTEAYGDIRTDAAIMREVDHETATKGLKKSRGAVLSKVIGGRNVVEQDSATPFGHGCIVGGIGVVGEEMVEGESEGKDEEEAEHEADKEGEPEATQSENSECPENSVLNNQPQPLPLQSENSEESAQDQENSKAQVAMLFPSKDEEGLSVMEVRKARLLVQEEQGCGWGHAGLEGQEDEGHTRF
ncbi:hypothetical protein POM88_010538 [Heracleum sosnowskyi]|uniref:Uncharacterized protein n=1 Tax=Heracleum sosnowskyi TaxID=360622 RepID=A0AAD8IW66_9APIA|nr:hypothetical protein POM88_010538 [Heracleum sosnowskyi]